MSKFLKAGRALVPAVAVLAFVGCNGDDPDPADDPAAAEMPFDVETAGHVTGQVHFAGEPPPPEVLDMSSEPNCAEMYDEAPTRDLVKIEDGRLADVLIYVRDGLDDMQFPVVRDAPVMDQVACRYTPHVVSVRAGQTFIFRNSDGLLHNINASPERNRPFNISQPVNMDTERQFAEPEVAIPVRCDVHGWMRGYVGVFDHPYYAVSGDNGGFDLSELPPGDYVVEAWHSQLGTLEQQVTVTTGETTEVTFEFDEGMLASANVPMGEPIDPHDHSDPASIFGGNHGGHGPTHGSVGGRR